MIWSIDPRELAQERKVSPSLTWQKDRSNFSGTCNSLGKKLRKELRGISSKTLSRSRKEFQINDEESFHSLTDEELVTIMQEIMNVTPGIGQMRMLGALKSRGQRWRVRFFMH